MPHVFLDGQARLGTVFHALCAFALLFACSGQALAAVGLYRGQEQQAARLRRWSALALAAFIAAYSMGLLLYPHYRYWVRGVHLDRAAPWASNLFDMKENLVALALPLVVASFALGRRLEPSRDRALLPFLAGAALATWGLVAFAVASGVVVASARGM